MELYDRDKNGGLFELDSSIYVDSLKFLTPEGKAVYGGGGITPDVFIPYDTSGYTTLYRKIAYTQMFSEFTLSFLDRNRGVIQRKSLNHYLKTFSITDKVYKDFLSFATTKDITYSVGEASASERRIKQRLKEDIASGIWDDEGRLYIHSRSDSDVLEVLK